MSQSFFKSIRENRCCAISEEEKCGFAVELGERFAVVRRQQHLYVRTVAETAGIPLDRYRKIERGQVLMELDEFVSLTIALNVAPSLMLPLGADGDPLETLLIADRLRRLPPWVAERVESFLTTVDELFRELAAHWDQRRAQRVIRDHHP